MLRTRDEKIFQVFNYGFLTILALMMVYPFWEVIRISISSPADTAYSGFRLWPKEVWWGGYAQTLGNKYIWIGYKNTIIRLILGVSIRLFLSVLCAYPLSRRYFPHRGFWTMLIVFTMFFRGGLIPLYLLVQKLNLGNTVWALVLPLGIDTFAMLIMRNFFMAIPTSLEDSAKIDGANDWTILIRIIIPLSVPIIMTVALWSMVWHWNAWFDCLIYIRDASGFVLQVVLRKIVFDASPQFTPETVIVNTQVTQSGEVIKMAAVMVSTLPILFVYPFMQKYFIKGVLVGSLKG
jgi:putative aldouronate transport system permease protein